jgi:hypothetical protein
MKIFGLEIPGLTKKDIESRNLQNIEGKEADSLKWGHGPASPEVAWDRKSSGELYIAGKQNIPEKLRQTKISYTKTISSGLQGAGFVGKQSQGKYDYLLRKTIHEQGIRPVSKVSKPREPITDINQRWQDMMQDKQNTVRGAGKAKRSISFNEQIIYHPIKNIQELEALYEESDEDQRSVDEDLDDRSKKLLNEINIIEMTLSEIEETHKFGYRDHYTEHDNDSVTSLKPGCPTPERIKALVPALKIPDTSGKDI